VHEKLMRALPLSSSQLEMVASQMKLRRAELDLGNGKQQFVARQYDEATKSLKRANDFYRSRKLRFALLGLRAAPGALRYMYGIWNWILMRRIRGSSLRSKKRNEQQQEASGRKPCVELQDS
jgi:hypothetical protein